MWVGEGLAGGWLHAATIVASAVAKAAVFQVVTP
jgi:hypothetical protein